MLAEHSIPRLLCDVVESDGHLVLRRDGLEFDITSNDASPAEIRALLEAMDGSRTVEKLKTALLADSALSVESLVADLERLAMLDLVEKPEYRSGTDVLLELEDLANELIAQKLYTNVFWRNLLGEDMACPTNVLYGVAIENYHFLFREAYFDSPILGFQANTEVRGLLNEFYVGEYGHDRLVLRSLGTIGISEDDLMETVPLPETMAMCNALSFWASSDPLFFMTTLGILEGKESEIDSYILACERYGLDKAFIKPMRKHAEINSKGGHGNLTRCIFASIPQISHDDARRMRRLTHLFIDIYDQFYTAIWNYYSQTPTLLRRVSAI